MIWTCPGRLAWMDKATYEQIPETLEVRQLRVRVQTRGFRTRVVEVVTTLLDAKIYTKANCILIPSKMACGTRPALDQGRPGHGRAAVQDPGDGPQGDRHDAGGIQRGPALMARAAKEHDRIPRRLSFKGALQSLLGFAEKLRESSAEKRDWLWEIILGGIANDEVGNRPDRIEPRARKRRPKPYTLLTKPRKQAQNALRKAS